MKKTIISLFGFFLALTVLAGFTTVSVQAQNPLLGTWVFTASQAPWEYSRGKVVFETKEKEVTGKVLFTSGVTVNMTKVVQEKDKVTFDFSVEGIPVKTVVTLEGNEFKGHAETYEGRIPFNGKKELPEKK
jgi:hypothetical protein